MNMANQLEAMRYYLRDPDAKIWGNELLIGKVFVGNNSFYGLPDGFYYHYTWYTTIGLECGDSNKIVYNVGVEADNDEGKGWLSFTKGGDFQNDC